MSRVFRILCLWSSLVSAAAQASNPICQKWFERSKIKRGSSECTVRCSVIRVDLNNFYCPDQCDELCGPNRGRKCESVKTLWAQKIKSGSPIGWPNTNEVATEWSKGDIRVLYSALNKVPRSLAVPSIQGIYRKRRSLEWTENPASIFDGVVTLYDPAFSLKDGRLARILAHEFAHEYWRILPESQQLQYQVATGWHHLTGTSRWSGRRDGYVETDGRIGPIEDFANNIEYFPFDRAKLKKSTPGAYVWIEQRFGSGFRRGASCE